MCVWIPRVSLAWPLTKVMVVWCRSCNELGLSHDPARDPEGIHDHPQSPFRRRRNLPKSLCGDHRDHRNHWNTRNHIKPSTSSHLVNISLFMFLVPTKCVSATLGPRAGGLGTVQGSPRSAVTLQMVPASTGSRNADSPLL